MTVLAFKENTVTTGFPFRFLYVVPTCRLSHHWLKLGSSLGPCPGPSTTGVGPGGMPSAPSGGSSRDRVAYDPVPPCPGSGGLWRHHYQCVRATGTVTVLGLRPHVNRAGSLGLASVC